jgi:hypothetical protein
MKQCALLIKYFRQLQARGALMVNPVVDNIIDKLYQWVTNYRGREVIKDTSRINCKYDAFITSTASDPFSFTIFEMSDKGELLIDDVTRLADSEAAFFLFVNPESHWIVAVKNTLQNQARLTRQEPVENFKVKIVT